MTPQTPPTQDLAQVKTKIQSLLGREVAVEPVQGNKFACVYIDYNLRNALRLVADSEDLAYRNLLSYLEEDKNQGDSTDGRNAQPAPPRTDPPQAQGPSQPEQSEY